MSVFLMVSSMIIPAVRAEYEPCAKDYFAILAGGSGERLWPFSRKCRPKQLLSLADDRTLLEQAIDRVTPHTRSADQIWVITTRNHDEGTRALVGNKVGIFLTEPAARNTAPAIIYTCLQLYDKDPEAVVMFLPADPFIPQKDQALFDDAVKQALGYARVHDEIVLVGVQPTYPATGYGYINYEDVVCDNALAQVRKVRAFHEKPSFETACLYLNEPNMLWNIGMFAAKVGVFLNECKRVAPDLWQEMIACSYAQIPYEQVQSISIDYALIEKSDRVVVVPASFAWCDVGNVSTFLTIKKDYEHSEQKLISVDAHNNLIDVPDKLIALVGVSDLCVVQTDDVLLITKQEQAEKVRAVVNELKQSGYDNYL